MTKKSSIFLIIFFTFITTLGQVLLKFGANNNFFNLYTFFGLFFYGLATLIMIIALKDGELSVIYPIISLGFVWVTITSHLFFNEIIDTNKIIGITLIIAGTSIMGVKR